MSKKTNDKKSTEGLSTGTKVGVGVGLGVAAALAAGAYFLYGTDKGQKKRKEVKGWMLKVKGEVLEKMEKMKDINEDTYHQVVDTVVSKYKEMKQVDTESLLILAAEMKRHWNNIKKEIHSSIDTTSKNQKDKKNTSKTTKKKQSTSKKDE